MKKKLNLTNLLMAIVFIISVLIIASDLLTIIINTFMGKTVGWTWIGFITFILAFIIGGETIEYFKEQINK